MELSSARLLLARASLYQSKKIELLQKSRDLLSNIVLQKYTKESSNGITNSYTIPLYHELLADSYLQEKKFDSAR